MGNTEINKHVVKLFINYTVDNTYNNIIYHCPYFYRISNCEGVFHESLRYIKLLKRNVCLFNENPNKPL